MFSALRKGRRVAADGNSSPHPALGSDDRHHLQLQAPVHVLIGRCKEAFYHAKGAAAEVCTVISGNVAAALQSHQHTLSSSAGPLLLASVSRSGAEATDRAELPSAARAQRGRGGAPAASVKEASVGSGDQASGGGGGGSGGGDASSEEEDQPILISEVRLWRAGRGVDVFCSRTSASP
jgi:hypothetical protein